RGHRKVNPIEIRTLLVFRNLVADAGIPQQAALGVANQKAGYGECTGLTVVLASIRKHAHVLELGMAAVERVQPNLWCCIRGKCNRRQYTANEEWPGADDAQQKVGRHERLLALT